MSAAVPLLPLALAAPWALLAILYFAGVRLPRPLPAAGSRRGRPAPGGPEGAAPAVSVIVPARNEVHNIEAVLRSVTASADADFEVVVVDDRSEDGTAELARAVPPGRARRLIVVDGEPLPDGWLGKPWACRQGARAAAGELLLFTDADTVHAPDLLVRACAALDEDGAAVVTVVGRQITGSFWERVVQPQVFAGMLARYRDQRRPLPPARWRDAIANGQYILVRRAAYEAIGGHGAVRGEVIEDMRLAHHFVRAGHVLSVRRAEDALATRMYRSLGELVAGWSKNLWLGGLASVPPGPARAVLGPAALLTGALLWVVPPLVLVGSALAVAAGGAGAVRSFLLVWSGGAVAVSLLFWGVVYARFGVWAAYALLYPLGAAVFMGIFLRAWRRGGRVAWKGREYRVPAETDQR